jgi:glycosyltransferase involved in cell wall biosynthesis
MFRKKRDKILIIGKVPPPIGGVTIHTVRLLEYCKKENLKLEFYNFQDFNFLKMAKAIALTKKAHLHASNTLFQLLFVVLCRLLRTNSILTIHGDLFAHNAFMNRFQLYAVRFCNYPILLNEKSFHIAKKLNSNSKWMSAFIPPQKREFLSTDLQDRINYVKTKFKYVYCTNAHSLVFDKKGNETYGITSLVNFFNVNPKDGFIVSDPKGEYLRFFKNNNFVLGNNIVLLTGNHSFFEVLKQADCFIRNTTTDGDSLSIKEALFSGTRVIASNCVDRPQGVIVYDVSNPRSFENAFLKVKKELNFNFESTPINCAIELTELYK